MKHAAKAINRTLKAFFDNEAASGIILIVIAVLAMIVANSPLAHDYHDLFHGTLAWTPIAKLNNLHLWINDALMAIFFFVVGLEIKREVADGALADPSARRLPVIAAAMGMAVPAVVFLGVIAGEGAEGLHRGWAIPAATDIAFAMGVMGLLGNRVPSSLRLFLLTVAIVDDIGAVAIIAVFYTANLKLMWLIASLAVMAVMIGLNRFRVDRWWAYAALSLLLWYFVLNSGIHATIAGVVAALTIPMRLDARGDSLLLRFEHALLPWNAYLVVPLFGFANAGVAMAGIGLAGFLDPLPLGIAAGLVIGKQAGILAAIAACYKLKLAPKPEGATWMQLWGTSVLCGIGFTMSLFIGALAFPGYPHLIEEAKLGVLGGSLISALLGYAILRFAKGVPEDEEDEGAEPATGTA
ncbi:Na+/H+ antiporter NhaA [Croceicoccus naphthovorans]|uniref:Na(+)/H(+) antiporter NhaA n=1 Tax=Croceicoccus naphthovorans TaxID=1348774 RepID=A0A0G3XJP4_9SPHN|nr:Na+/H+ antiporter NhaA [Croceicoccus naphthovorans]AKM10824.1 pH-dependent sodium/proton antiporter [Croceicoccus naphthovorans]MBB3989038.1 NhaA family Na+:H+ antiporter [Croceicoccus naphthovorans]